MTNKHTPGPWEAADRGDYSDLRGNSRIVLGDDRRIAIVQHSGCAEDEANARLIAAVPDLLEALRAIITHPAYAESEDGETGEPCELIAAGRDAIAKAEDSGNG